MIDIYVYDDIGPEWAGMVSAKGIVAAIKDAGNNPINLKINSPGGDVNEAAAIYNALMSHSAGVEVSIDGIAASAASYIAMAGSKIKIAENAKLMIHRAWTFTAGNSVELSKVVDVLAGYDTTIAAVYAKRSGKTEAEILDKMTAETWFNAADAVAFGLADEVGQKLKVKNAIPPGRFVNAPRELIDTELPKQYALKRESARLKLLLTKEPTR